jgi:CRP-like cAMP-binding protein
VGGNEARLAAIALFADVDDAGLGRIASCASEFEAPVGHVLVEVGRPGAGLFVLEAGEVSVDLPGGRTVRLGPGEFFGELSLLTDQPHTARVRAVTDVRCLAISRRDFAEILAAEPTIAVAMLPVLARRLMSLL